MYDNLEAELASQREWALRHPLSVLEICLCTNPEHRAEGDFWLTILGWTLEAFVEQAFSGVWERTA